MEHLRFARTPRASSYTSATDGNYTASQANKTINTLQQPERDHTRTTGYYEPITTILDHLAFSPRLSPRAVAALGASSQAFSDQLS